MNIKKCRRILSLLLCVMLILSSMSIPVFAEEAGGAPCAHGNTVAREEAGEAASCTAEGSHTVITECADCGEELSRESVTDKALGHDYRETARKMYFETNTIKIEPCQNTAYCRLFYAYSLSYTANHINIRHQNVKIGTMARVIKLS